MQRAMVLSALAVWLVVAAGGLNGQATQPAGPPAVLRAGPAGEAEDAPAAQPVGGGPTTRPADAQDIQGRVVEVRGSVAYRSASRGGEFRPVVQGMMLAADVLVTAGPKAHAVIAFGENSVVVLEQLSTFTIAELYQARVADVPTVVTRLKLVNGSVRAGVERGRTQSDFEVSTPVATLSVRGTRPIRIEYNAGTGDLWFALGREGRITGRLTGGGRSVDVLPGEHTDQTLTTPVVMAAFGQHVRLGDPMGQAMQEFIVEVFNPSGTGSFGGGNPQNLGSVVQAGERMGRRPKRSDDGFYPDDDVTADTSK